MADRSFPTADSVSDDSPIATADIRSLSGRKLVVGLLLFGVVMVAVMGLYWELYTRPFRPLQEAIHAEFPESHPRVIGGRHKSHRPGTPHVLRIVVQVGFDPETADAATIDDHVSRLRALADESIDLDPYDELEIHLSQHVPERENRSRVFRFPLNE